MAVAAPANMRTVTLYNGFWTCSIPNFIQIGQKNVENKDKNPFVAFSMDFTAPDVTAMCQEVWQIRAEGNLRHCVKRDRHCAGFHKLNYGCTIFVKNSRIDFHENLINSLFSIARVQMDDFFLLTNAEKLCIWSEL